MNSNKKMTSAYSRWQYYRLHWKRGLVRVFYRSLFRAAYFFSPAWAFNLFFLTMPEELIPETLIKFGAKIGQETTVMPPLHIHNMGKKSSNHFENLTIGSHCYLGPELFLDLKNRVEIEDRATISMRVSLITHLDVGNSPLGLHHFPPQNQPIIIRQGAYIGAGTTVLMGVDVGECAVIGAGSVVTKHVPAWSVIVGGTSKVIKRLE